MLTEKLRPHHFKEIFGQKPLIDVLEKSIEAACPFSFLLWGPPGSGKTSIANIYIRSFDLPYFIFSGAKGSVLDIKKLIDDRANSPLFHKKIIIFIDEIHRLTKNQQDFFLPHVESGELILVGATTENPSFCLNSAVISRLRIFALESLSEDSSFSIIEKCKQIHPTFDLTKEQENELITISQGDGRQLILLLENLMVFNSKLVNEAQIRYNRSGDDRYEWISVLQKAIRGSDPDASLYALARMIHGKEDPIYIFRRLLRICVEDIGLADPACLPYVFSALESFEKIGSPEGDLILASCVVYLALSPKSNAIYKAFNQALDDAKKTMHFDAPKQMVNGTTELMRKMGFGKGYQYDHECPNGFSGQNYFPEGMDRKSYYHPQLRGFERDLKKRLDYFNALREKLIFRKEKTS